MSLSYGKRDLAKAVAVLDADHESAEDAAKAILDFAFDLYEAKAKWTAVSQVDVGPNVSEDGHRFGKVAWGVFSTETQAANVAFKAAGFSSATGESFRSWVLPTFHGTPHEWAKQRKLEIKSRDFGHAQADLLVDLIQWQLDNPDLDRELYPGIEPPNYHCPSCGRPFLEEGHEAVLDTLAPLHTPN